MLHFPCAGGTAQGSAFASTTVPDLAALLIMLGIFLVIVSSYEHYVDFSYHNGSLVLFMHELAKY